MKLDDLRQLLDYHYWARDRMLDAASQLAPGQLTRGMQSSFASVRDTLVHVYGAEWVWLRRYQGEAPASLPDGQALTDVDTIRAAWRTVEAELRAFVEALGEGGLHRVFEYRLFSGAAGASTYAQAIQHLVNHATYHRGQVTTLLRQLSAAPPASTDLITFVRERAVHHLDLGTPGAAGG